MEKYKTLITAHSGADNTPDNSLEFVRYALASETDALEVDVRREPKNGDLILSHDEMQDGSQPFLRQVFEMVAQHPSMQINCDLKEAGLEQSVFTLAEPMGLADRLIFSGTVDPRCFADMPMKKEKIYWNIDEQIPELYQRCQQDPAYALQAAEKMCSLCTAFGIRTMNVYEGLVDDHFLEILNRHGIRISVWTVNEQERISYFLSRHVRNITTRKLAEALTLTQEEA